ncbi:MAG: TRAP transporter small permease [Roseovarius sp.]
MALLRLFYSAQRIAAGLLMLAMTVLYGLNVIIRSVVPSLASELAWIEEVVSFMLIWTIFLAAGVALVERRHVSIDMVLERLPGAAQRALTIAINLTGAATSLYIAWLGWNLTSFVAGSGQISPVLGVPMSLLYTPTVLGGLVLALGFFINLAAPGAFSDEGRAGRPGEIE